MLNTVYKRRPINAEQITFFADKNEKRLEI